MVGEDFFISVLFFHKNSEQGKLKVNSNLGKLVFESSPKSHFRYERELPIIKRADFDQNFPTIVVAKQTEIKCSTPDLERINGPRPHINTHRIHPKKVENTLNVKWGLSIFPLKVE